MLKKTINKDDSNDVRWKDERTSSKDVESTAFMVKIREIFFSTNQCLVIHVCSQLKVKKIDFLKVIKRSAVNAFLFNLLVNVI